MQYFQKHRAAYFALFALVFAIAFLVYPPFRGQAQRPPAAGARPEISQDTTRRKSAAFGNADKTHEEVQVELEKAAKKLEWEVCRMLEKEWSKLGEELARAMKEIDADRTRSEMDKARECIDFAAIGKELDEVKRSINCQEVEAPAKAEIEKLDLHKIEQEFQELRLNHQADIERVMEKVHQELLQSKIDLDATLKDVRKQMEKARAEWKQIESGMDELKKDGIIRAEEPAFIEWDGDTLIVNGKRQSAAVSAKYRAFFNDQKFSVSNKSHQIDL